MNALYPEVINYLPNDKSNISIQVTIEDDTVWLTQLQMMQLFNSSKQNVSLHINNIFKEKELEKISVVKYSLITASDGKKYKTAFYNLDVIISVGYRIKSKRGTQFRIWATGVLREYLLKGYAFQRRIVHLENKVDQHDEKLQELIRASLPAKEGVFFDGQIFDAHHFVANLIRKAKKSLILVDNYVDDTVLYLFAKRKKGVQVRIYTQKIGRQLELDSLKFNAQYEPLEIKLCKRSHDRFLIIDEKELYHIGASIKDLGKRWFAFSKLEINPKILLSELD